MSLRRSRSPPKPPRLQSPPSSKRTCKLIKEPLKVQIWRSLPPQRQAPAQNNIRTTTPIRHRTLNHLGSTADNQGELGVHALEMTPQTCILKLEAQTTLQTAAQTTTALQKPPSSNAFG
ncbi:unnamed protein product [Brassica oleracea var. botrytis]